jgi:hypothetical protein
MDTTELAQPDKLTPVLVSIFFYASLSYLIHRMIQKPKGLDDMVRGEYFDYFGQHVSIIHSLLSLFLSFGSYIYHGGVHYNMPTTLD